MRGPAALVVLCMIAIMGCGASHSGVAPVSLYRGAVRVDPAADLAVLSRAAAVDPSRAEVRIFEALPRGVELREGALHAAPGYEHQFVGKYLYSLDKYATKSDLVRQVKRVTIAAGADAAIVALLGVDPGDVDKARGVEAAILRLDPRAIEAIPAGPGAE